jgi:hypothetical protein
MPSERLLKSTLLLLLLLLQLPPLAPNVDACGRRNRIVIAISMPKFTSRTHRNEAVKLTSRQDRQKGNALVYRRIGHR